MRATEIIAENLIREAQERGEFDNLAGAGKRLDLEEYFTIPEEMRMAYTMLRNANFQNQESALASRIERLKQRLEKEPAGPDRTRLVNLQQELEAKLRSLTENPAIFP